MQDGKSTRSLRAWYERINAKFFFGELPANVIVRWTVPEDSESDIAAISAADNKRYSWVIVLNAKKISTKSQLLSSLLHECIHVATGNRDCHGPVFSEWHQKLIERGAFKKGALLRGITLF
jgi:hypothetical protein